MIKNKWKEVIIEMKKLYAPVVLLVLALMMASPVLADSVTLNVDGMTCGLCPRAVKKSLEKTAGVQKAAVSYKNGEGKAIVEYDEKKTDTEALIRAIEKAGYKASVMEGKR